MFCRSFFEILEFAQMTISDCSALLYQSPKLISLLSQPESVIHPKPLHDKSSKITCAPSKDSTQTWHMPSLIGVCAVCMKKH